MSDILGPQSDLPIDPATGLFDLAFYDFNSLDDLAGVTQDTGEQDNVAYTKFTGRVLEGADMYSQQIEDAVAIYGEFTNAYNDGLIDDVQYKQLTASLLTAYGIPVYYPDFDPVTLTDEFGSIADRINTLEGDPPEGYTSPTEQYFYDNLYGEGNYDTAVLDGFDSDYATDLTNPGGTVDIVSGEPDPTVADPTADYANVFPQAHTVW